MDDGQFMTKAQGGPGGGGRGGGGGGGGGGAEHLLLTVLLLEGGMALLQGVHDGGVVAGDGEDALPFTLLRQLLLRLHLLSLLHLHLHGRRILHIPRRS